MPITLPGLFDFSSGINSAIAQQAGRADANTAQANSFVNLLNAFNTGQNTQDNLQFRSAFENSQGSVLDRFDNILNTTNNPFVAGQASVQQQSLAPLLAQRAIQNPFFARSQGLPTTADGALNQGLLGFNPIFQNDANSRIAATLAQFNPNLSGGQLGSNNVNALSTALDLQRQEAQIRLQERLAEATEKAIERQNKQLEALEKRIGQSSTATSPSTALPSSNFTRGTSRSNILGDLGD